MDIIGLHRYMRVRGEKMTRDEWRNIKRAGMLFGCICMVLVIVSGLYQNRKAREYRLHLAGVISEQYGDIDAEVLNALAGTSEVTYREEGENYLKQNGYRYVEKSIYINEAGNMVLLFGSTVFLCIIGFLLYIKKQEIKEQDRLGALSEKMKEEQWQLQLVQKEKQKMREFVENISHQLKTPIATCKIYIENLQRKISDDSILEKLEVCERQMDIMTGLIADLMKAGRIESGSIRFTLEENIVGITMEKAWNRVVALAQEKQLKMQCSGCEKTFLYDELWMTEAMENLLKNCIQYAECGSDIVVRAERANTYFKIEIEDKGAHVKDEEIEKMFVRFFVSEQKVGNNSGVGLHLAQVIVEGHHGRIWAENLDYGMKFCIQLPVLCGAETYETN